MFNRFLRGAGVVTCLGAAACQLAFNPDCKVQDEAGNEVIDAECEAAHPYARERGIEPGSVVAATTPGARFDLVGRRSLQVRPDGELRVTGLEAGGQHVAVSVDDEGDGIVDGRADLSVELRVEEVNQDVANFTKVDLLSSALLGAVTPRATATIRGLALVDVDGLRPASDIGAHTRVVAYRFVDVSIGGVGAAVTRAVEAEATADDTGAFELVGVGPGVVQLAAFTFAGEDQVGELVAVSEPLALRPDDGQIIDLGDRPLVARDPPQVELQLDLIDAIDGGTAFFWRRGAPARPECRPSPDNEEVAIGALVSVPAGLYDLVLCDADNVEQALIAGLAVPALDPQRHLPLNIAPLSIDLPVVNDLDGDGLVGLPPYTNEPDAVWFECIAACQNAHGAGAAATSCETGGITFDCDDDADFQADVTEPPACYGRGLGGDRDGDGLCDPDDPFPYCAANAASACAADNREHTPGVPGELEVTP